MKCPAHVNSKCKTNNILYPIKIDLERSHAPPCASNEGEDRQVSTVSVFPGDSMLQTTHTYLNNNINTCMSFLCLSMQGLTSQSSRCFHVSTRFEAMH